MVAVVEPRLSTSSVAPLNSRDMEFRASVEEEKGLDADVLIRLAEEKES